MDAIICDISAWEYWRTPPALRDVEIPVDIARAKSPTASDWNGSQRYRA